VTAIGARQPAEHGVGAHGGRQPPEPTGRVGTVNDALAELAEEVFGSLRSRREGWAR